MHVIYTGDRVRLRPFRDADEYIEMLRTMYDGATEFWGFKRCPLERERERFNDTGGLDERRGQLAIELLETGDQIGCMAYTTGLPSMVSNIGTHVNAEYRHRGFGVEGKQLLMCCLFENRPLLRIEAVTLEHHSRARRSVELAGMSLESISIRRCWSQGRLASWATYRIFREEWEQLPIRQIVRRGVA